MILSRFHQNCAMHIQVCGVLQLVCYHISARSLHFVFAFTCIQAYQYYDRCVVRLVDVVMCVFICIQVMRVGGSYCPRGSMPTTSHRALAGARQRFFYRVFKERVFLIFIHQHTHKHAHTTLHNTTQHTHTHTHTHIVFRQQRLACQRQPQAEGSVFRSGGHGFCGVLRI